MQSVAGKERRAHPRTRVEIEAFLSCSDVGADRHTVWVQDISLSGMAIHPGDLTLRVDDKLFLCLSGKSEQCDRDHVIEATVVRLERELVGLQFDSVGISVLKDIHRLLHNARIF